MIRIETSGSTGLVPSATIEVLSDEPFTAPDALVRFRVDTTNMGLTDDSSLAFSWKFGDGQTGSGQVAENLYQNPGFFSVIVTVTETFADGQKRSVQASKIIQVSGSSSLSSVVGQSMPDDDETGGSTASSGGMCGSMGPAMVLMLCAGLLGLRRRRQPTL